MPRPWLFVVSAKFSRGAEEAKKVSYLLLRLESVAHDPLWIKS
jgi:hypothetical protein